MTGWPRGGRSAARRALWDLFSVSALNIAGDDASLALAATVVKTGLLGKNNAADIGVPALPLGELHGDAAATVLAKLGAQVTLGAKVTAIEVTAIEVTAIEGGAIEGGRRHRCPGAEAWTLGGNSQSKRAGTIRYFGADRSHPSSHRPDISFTGQPGLC